jgi:uncharacterized protein YfaS (alpha-2-macroglobulin family)
MCGAPEQAEGLPALTAEQIGEQAVVQGVVRVDGDAVPGAYVRLLDSTGEFVAEVRTSATGHFRFFAADGDWTLSVLAPGGGQGRATVTAAKGEVAESEITLAA